MMLTLPDVVGGARIDARGLKYTSAFNFSSSFWLQNFVSRQTPMNFITDESVKLFLVRCHFVMFGRA